jgi:peptidoglycan-N-acetylglucosamine deacetylase
MRHGMLIVAAVVGFWLLPSLAEPQGTAVQQPGLKWSEDQLKKAAHHVRAGRTLTPKVWPNGARVAVCLSFDPDDFSIQLNRGDTNVVGVSLGEYAPLTGIPRLLKLLQKYNIPASFYIPAVSAMMHPEMIQELKKGPYEVGIHGWIHENPETINDEAEEWRLTSQALDLLEKQWGRRPVGNRNPSWTMSQYTIGLLKKANLLYDTSLQAMDQPHDILLDGQSTDIIELPVNWILDDPLVGPTGQLPQPRLLMKTFQDDFDVAYKEGTLFMLTMHPHTTPQRSRIKYLEELIVYMKSKPGVWFATAEDIAKYIKQQTQTGGIAGSQ